MPVPNGQVCYYDGRGWLLREVPAGLHGRRRDLGVKHLVKRYRTAWKDEGNSDG